MLQNLKKITFSKINIKNTPKTPGVYLFFDNKNIIYIGKSINLNNRIHSYTAVKLLTKTKLMISEVIKYSYIQTSSEIEALLLESKLIKRYKPKYNIQLKDDKNPLYIRITKEKYPQILFARKVDLKEKNTKYFGPFTSSQNVKTVLKIIRRIFPYSQHKIGNRPCFYSQIGLCNPCPNHIDGLKNEPEKVSLRNEYMKNISYIKRFLQGDLNKIKQELKKEMLALSEKEKFEDANKLKLKISQIEYITKPNIPVGKFIDNPNLYSDIRSKESLELKKIINKYYNLDRINRIECFDIAHFAGYKPTASMVVFINSEKENSLYRHFTIKQKNGSSDTDSMNEVGRRRKKYLDKWGRPDLIIVDGGKGQVTSFKKGFSNNKIPVIGLTKRYETLIIPIIENGKLRWENNKLQKGYAKNLIVRLRDESHRFARRLHHTQFNKEINN